MIYLDHNATTPLLAAAAQAMTPYFRDQYANPSSTHAAGRRARRAVEQAREQLAATLNCHPDEVIFTGGGTESNNMAVKGAAWARQGQGNHLITSAVEHPAVLDVCRWLARRGFRLTVLPVDRHGRVDPADLARAISPDTVLVSVMQANNEVGTLQPIAELAAIAHAHGALMHTDAAQAVGKVPVDMAALGVDLLTVAGHKLYGPKGIGALVVRTGVGLEPLMQGAGHEQGRRPGTENVPAIVGLGQASAAAAADLAPNMARFRARRDRLQANLEHALGPDRVQVNGHPHHRLPNTLSVSFRQVEANTLLDHLGDELAASPGAACHAGSVKISAVLQAMGVPSEWAMGTIRLSVGRDTTAAEVDAATALLLTALAA